MDDAQKSVVREIVREELVSLLKVWGRFIGIGSLATLVGLVLSGVFYLHNEIDKFVDDEIRTTFRSQKTEIDANIAEIVLLTRNANQQIEFVRNFLKVADQKSYDAVVKLIKLVESTDQKATLNFLANMPHAVVAFNLESGCPDGWKDYAPAYGRFIRGIDKSLAVDPSGKLRKAGSTEPDAFQGHWHNVFTVGPGREHEPCAFVIAHLPFAEQQDQGFTITVGDSMKLGVQAAFRAADAAGNSPFLNGLAAVRWALR